MFRYQEHLATIEESELRVSTILQKPGHKFPTIIAYALAKLSRNPLTKDMAQILEEVLGQTSKSEANMETIVGGYGHTSVTGMGHLTCTLEGLGILESLEFFYKCRYQDGQETSTRYIDFSKSGITKEAFTPPDNRLPQKRQEEYYNILFKQMKDYQDLIEPTSEYLEKKFNIIGGPNKEASVLKARTFDCVRYLIPLATKTKVGAIQSAREWAKYIKVNLNSNNQTSAHLAQLLKTLLTEAKGEYVPEADILIRHTDNYSSCIPALLQLVTEGPSGLSINPTKGWPWYHHYNASTNDIIYRRLLKLKYPNSIFTSAHPCLSSSRGISQLLFNTHTHHNEMGPMFQHGADTIEGIMDIGSLKDINRHRSLELFTPFLHEEADIKYGLLSTPTEDQYLTPPYIDQDSKLWGMYNTRLSQTYTAICEWADKVSTSYAMPCIKKLLPQAHLVQYEASGSLADWSYTTQLRVRNGGHIAYRQWAYKIAETLAGADSIYQGLVEVLTKPDPNSKEQFLDRS